MTSFPRRIASRRSLGWAVSCAAGIAILAWARPHLGIDPQVDAPAGKRLLGGPAHAGQAPPLPEHVEGPSRSIPADAVPPGEGPGGASASAQPPADRVVLRDGEVFLGETPLGEVDLERWPLDRLRALAREIQRLQVQEMQRLLPQLSIDAYFVSNDEYFARRMWHEESVIYGVQRALPTDGGEEVQESGYVVVPKALAPQAYALREAVVRAYRTPAFSQFLLQEGRRYEARILEEHPDAVVDVTSDLTHWKYFSPDGKLIGSLSFPRDGNL